MNGNLQIDDSMPEDLKNAISFLNEHNTTPDEVDSNLPDEIELNEVGGTFGNMASDNSDSDGLNDSSKEENDEHQKVDFGEPSDLNLDDLDSMF